VVAMKYPYIDPVNAEPVAVNVCRAYDLVSAAPVQLASVNVFLAYEPPVGSVTEASANVSGAVVLVKSPNCKLVPLSTSAFLNIKLAINASPSFGIMPAIVLFLFG